MDTFPEITHDDLLKELHRGSVTLIDCNGTESFKVAHVPHAIDFESEQGRLVRLLPKDRSELVVAYCGSPTCTAYLRGADAARSLGYTNVKHYAPGISGWKEAHAKIESAMR